MTKVALVTDSTCDLPHEFVRKFGIEVVPIRIHCSRGDFRDGVDITAEEVMEVLDREFPKTSMPSPDDIGQVFERLVQEGFTHCIVLSVSSAVSGTFGGFRMMAEESSMNIHVIDSKGASWILGFLVMEAARLVRESIGFDEAVKKLEEAAQRIKGFFVLDTFEYLQAGGRIGKVAAALGSVLNIKPIITFDEQGALHPYTLARGKKQAVNKLLEATRKQMDSAKAKIAVLHSRAEREAEELKKRLEEWSGIVEIHVSHITPALSVHAGPGLLGLVVSPVFESE